MFDLIWLHFPINNQKTRLNAIFDEFYSTKTLIFLFLSD